EKKKAQAREIGNQIVAEVRGGKALEQAASERGLGVGAEPGHRTHRLYLEPALAGGLLQRLASTHFSDDLVTDLACLGLFLLQDELATDLRSGLLSRHQP